MRAVSNYLLYGAALSLFLAGGVVAKAAETSVSVHSGPGPQFPILAEIPAGDEILVADCVKGWGQHDWCKVSIFGGEGYIHEGALAPSGERVVVAPVLTTRAATLRNAGRSGSPAVASVPASTKVDVAHCTHGWLRGWCKVTYAGRSGYVPSNALHRYSGQ
jgi:uncharacterized protein YraI